MFLAVIFICFIEDTRQKCQCHFLGQSRFLINQWISPAFNHPHSVTASLFFLFFFLCRFSFGFYFICKSNFVRPISFTCVTNIVSCFGSFSFFIFVGVYLFFQRVLLWNFYPADFAWSIQVFSFSNLTILCILRTILNKTDWGNTYIFYHIPCLIPFTGLLYNRFCLFFSIDNSVLKPSFLSTCH